jgi:hypothetical protein
MSKLVSIFIVLIGCLFVSCRCECPIEDNPSVLSKCVIVDISVLISLAQNLDDFTPLCQLADRFMECLKTYTRGCVGYYVN